MINQMTRNKEVSLEIFTVIYFYLSCDHIQNIKGNNHVSHADNIGETEYFL